VELANCAVFIVAVGTIGYAIAHFGTLNALACMYMDQRLIDVRGVPCDTRESIALSVVRRTRAVNFVRPVLAVIDGIANGYQRDALRGRLNAAECVLCAHLTILFIAVIVTLNFSIALLRLLMALTTISAGKFILLTNDFCIGNFGTVAFIRCILAVHFLIAFEFKWNAFAVGMARELIGSAW
jgi:hypothetical protein